jgi:Uma2 family endonuclease
MATAAPKSITLEEFLELPETKPASECIDGVIIRKPMPKGRHSRLQIKLCTVINQVAEDRKIANAFPELRSSFGGRSIIPDVAIFQWQRIPFTADGEVPDNFERHPDWVIEILSPEQKPNKVIDNILHCLSHNSQLGWFLDPSDRSILIFLPNQQPVLFQGSDSLWDASRRLPTMAEIELELTADRSIAILPV